MLLDQDNPNHEESQIQREDAPSFVYPENSVTRSENQTKKQKRDTSTLLLEYPPQNPKNAMTMEESNMVEMDIPQYTSDHTCMSGPLIGYDTSRPATKNSMGLMQRIKW